MMTNLFIHFDPSTSTNQSMNWSSMILIMMLMPPMMWLYPSRINSLTKNLMKTIYTDMKPNLSNNNKKLTIFFMTTMLFIMTNNTMGLFPYIFTATSHTSISMSMALPLWMTLMTFGWMNKTNKMLYHLVPNGTPMLLASFMVIIETLSNLIRPLTLSVRLTANMIAGHLLMILLSSTANNSTIMFSSTTLIMSPLTTLETAVALIQSYVFMTLITLYMSEI